MISLSGYILDSLTLNETPFDHLAMMLPWVWTWIGVNHIEPLTTEGWFNAGHGIKGGKENYYGT